MSYQHTASGYAQAALDRECEILAGTNAGRNEQTNRSSFNLGQLCGGGSLGFGRFRWARF